MIKIDVNSKYIKHITENNFDGIVSELKNDLTERANCIFKRVQTTPPPPPSVLLQTSHNNLRRSIEMIQVEGIPLFKNEGQCKGVCIWTIALFENIKKNHPEIPAAKILVEIVKEFSEGVGIHGTVIQMCFEKGKGPLLLKSLNLHSETITNIVLKNNEVFSNLQDHIAELEDGSFMLTFPGWRGFWSSREKEDTYTGHATAIFIEKSNYFFFDINAGLVGTGNEIGTENKVDDVTAFLSVAAHYLPLQRARLCFEKGIQKLIDTFPKEKAEWINKVAPILRKATVGNRGWLDAFGVLGLIHGLNGKVTFSKEEEDQLFSLLCLEPGHMFCMFENTDLSLTKYQLVE